MSERTSERHELKAWAEEVRGRHVNQLAGMAGIEWGLSGDDGREFLRYIAEYVAERVADLDDSRDVELEADSIERDALADYPEVNGTYVLWSTWHDLGAWRHDEAMELVGNIPSDDVHELPRRVLWAIGSQLVRSLLAEASERVEG